MVQIVADASVRSYCCLGVAEESHGCRWEYKYKHESVAKRFGPKIQFLPLYGSETREVALDTVYDVHPVTAAHLRDVTMRWLGLHQPDPVVVVPAGLLPVPDGPTVKTLGTLNDTDLLPLPIIADVIESQLFDWNGTWEQAFNVLSARRKAGELP